MSEKRDFKMHQKLLQDVITRQAGSIEKAVLEGVMNSIEAGAKKIVVTLKADEVSIADDGKGFQSREEIEKWFEVFGQPHEESEGKRWAQFRMGRGQLFAFGINWWTTNKWEMVVDIRQHLGYELKELEKPVKGCLINVFLYEKLADSAINWTSRQIAQQVKYVDAAVLVNGTVVNTDPAGEKWGPQTNDDAYVRFGVGRGLEIYNLGVHVCSILEGRFGVTGVVVAKKQLKVNFARNDILNDCPVWKSIRNLFGSKNQLAALLGKRVLSDGERDNLIERLVSGELRSDQLYRSPLFVDISGHAHSASSLSGTSWPQWSYLPDSQGDKDLRADHLLQVKRCLVLTQECVEAFLPAIRAMENLFSHGWKTSYGTSSFRPNLPYVPYAKIAATVDSNHELLPEDALAPKERIWLELIRAASYYVGRALNDGRNPAWNRTLYVGRSTSALAWTDGKSYVAFARHFLARKPFMGFKGRPHVGNIHEVLLTLLHEYCHDGDSLRQRHTPDFYRAYHDGSLRGGIAHSKVCSFLLDPERMASLTKRVNRKPKKPVVAVRAVAARSTPKPKRKCKTREPDI